MHFRQLLYLALHSAARWPLHHLHLSTLPRRCLPRNMLSSSSSAPASSSAPPASNATFRHLLSSVIPPLTSSSHKGQNGRLTVVGGSAAYTGAPYFSSLTTLKLGADLCTVLCSVEAAAPIKSYSPELMVRPTLIPQHLLDCDGVHPVAGKGKGARRQEAIQAIVDSVQKEVLERSNVVIVGPGLGKDELIVDTVAALLIACRSLSVPVVLDGDGINIAVSHPSVIRGNSQLVLTPNAAEFRRLWDAYLPDAEKPPMSLPVDAQLTAFMTENREVEGGFFDAQHPFATHTAQLARAIGGATVVRKGAIDVVSDGSRAVYCCRQGAPRRCGGQGDVLTGAIGTVWAWCGLKRQRDAEEKKRGGGEQKEDTSEVVKAKEGGEELKAELLAAYCGSLLVRKSAELAFKAHGRSMLASHVMDGMEDVIEETAPVRSKI